MDPESVQLLLAKDGKYPIEMVFDFWVYYRNNIRKDLFPETGGLLGNHGEEWWRLRSLVQPFLSKGAILTWAGGGGQ